MLILKRLLVLETKTVLFLLSLYPGNAEFDLVLEVESICWASHTPACKGQSWVSSAPPAPPPVGLRPRQQQAAELTLAINKWHHLHPEISLKQV